MADRREPPPPDDENWGPETPWQKPEPTPPPSQPPDSQWQQQYPQAQWGVTPSGQVRPPQTYLVPSILVTLFCFLPTGIAAIVFASQVTSKSSLGDFAGAAEASKKARLLIIWSMAVGVVVWVIVIAVGMSSSSNTNYMPAP